MVEGAVEAFYVINLIPLSRPGIFEDNAVVLVPAGKICDRYFGPLSI